MSLLYCLGLRASQYFRHQCSTGSSIGCEWGLYAFRGRFPGVKGKLYRLPLDKRLESRYLWAFFNA